jgi:mannose-6-phosphate isomerase class I
LDTGFITAGYHEAFAHRQTPTANEALSSANEMKMHDIPFGTTDWSDVERSEHLGETGKAFWRTRQFGTVRVRMVEYTAGYRADHWCEQGHILLCLEGELHTELKDGRVFKLSAGMSYQVADHAEPHRSFTANGARLFIVD